MLKHIVMWKVKGETPEERADACLRVKRSFESLQDKIPGLLALEVGIDISRVDYACDVVLYSEFDSQQALDAYATHPAHLAVREELGDIRTSRQQADYFQTPGSIFRIGSGRGT
jgi:quinol monooxygenase YgiN